MRRTILNTGILAAILFVPLNAAAQGEAESSPQPGESSVSLLVDGCADKCPSFEIVVYDTGRMIFRPKNSLNSVKGTRYKSGMRSIYTRIEKYLQDTGGLAQQSACTARASDGAVATVQGVKDSQAQKATWSSACAEQFEKGRSIVKVFVNQTGMWSWINSDSRYWEKYWEDWKRK